MTNSEMLREKIKNRNLSMYEVAKAIDLSREGFYKKINGETEFKASEIVKLSEFLNLNNKERDNIFLN